MAEIRIKQTARKSTGRHCPAETKRRRISVLPHEFEAATKDLHVYHTEWYRRKATEHANLEDDLEVEQALNSQLEDSLKNSEGMIIGLERELSDCQLEKEILQRKIIYKKNLMN